MRIQIVKFFGRETRKKDSMIRSTTQNSTTLRQLEEFLEYFRIKLMDIKSLKLLVLASNIPD
jgi:hypothetical protein